MERTTYRAKDFAPVVRQELRKRGWGIRRLARHCDQLHGRGLEHWRRGLNRWLNEGIKPSLENRQDVAEALGWERDTFASEEEDEDVSRVLDTIDEFLAQRFRIARDRVLQEGAEV